MRSPERLRAGQGFSLAEVLVALAITALLFIVALSVLSIDHKLYAKGDAVLECEREARYAAEMLERDLLMTGFQVDVRTISDPGPDGTDNTDDDIVGQPQIATATPWELVVNADLDAAIDAIQDGTTGEAVPSGYAPVTFFTSAETVRYTLDSNGDGAVTSDDRGDEPEETATQNPGLYLLRREVYGFNGTDNENPHGPVALVRGPATYPNGAQPVPLFLYWGEFDSDVALDLWGDTGAGGGTAGNGLLEPGEIAALTAVTDEDADNDNVIDSGEDRNGNGTLERRITQLIKRVEIHITTETPYPDPDYRDPVRSSTTTPFRYHTSTLTTEIKPRNTDLPGGACGDIPDPTSSPGVANACADAMADGKVQVTWTASDDDGTNENDIERYVLFRTDVDNIFGPTPYEEVLAGTSAWTDQWIEMRTWPPRQYWYRVRAMDCTPQLSDSDPVAGPYPAEVGASYPEYTWASDVPADDGTNVELVWTKSPDEGANTSGYGGVVDEYHVYRSTSPDYRCVAPVNDDAVAASGAATYTYMDNDTNSSSALTLGTLYYYWLRTLDDNGVLSPYSPRYCARPFVGPTFPIQRRIRVVPYASNDHPVEVYFANNPKNDNAGYNKYLIDYKIYRSDLSLVDIPTGYTSTHLEATVELQGLVWTAGGTSVARALHSINGGTNWRTYNNGSLNPLRDLAFADRLNGTMIGENGTILSTSDGGASWNVRTSGTTADLSDVAHVDESIAIVVGESGTVLRTANGGGTWAAVNTGLATDVHGVAAAGSVVLVTGNNGAAALSTDRGLNFTAISFTGDDLFGACAALEASNSISFIVGSEDAVFRSTDGGTTWNRIALAGAGNVNSVACVPGGPALAVATWSDQVWGTANGTTWSMQGVTTWHPRDVAMANAELAWIVDGLGRLHKRSSSGTWSSSFPDPGHVCNGVAARPEIAWQDPETTSSASGTNYYYVVTAKYAEGNATLDGECGLLADRSAAFETPDDALEQVLVDGCNSIELGTTIP